MILALGLLECKSRDSRNAGDGGKVIGESAGETIWLSRYVFLSFVAAQIDRICSTKMNFRCRLEGYSRLFQFMIPFIDQSLRLLAVIAVSVSDQSHQVP